MPTPVGAGPGNVATPVNTNPIQPQQVPGFDPAGAPLGDAHVWEGVVVGRGRQVNTALATGGKKVLDLAEQKALARLAADKPQEFMQRLLADSMNGTPVDVKFSREIKGFGVGSASFHVENGRVTVEAHVDVYNKVADQWLKPYLAKNPRTNGQRSRITLEVSGDIQRDGGVENIKAEAAAKNLPAFSPEKLQELAKVRKELEGIFKGKGSAAEKQKAVTETVDRALKQASDYGVGLILEIITGSYQLSADLKEAEHSTRVHADIGKGKFALTATDLLGSESKDEANLGAQLTGSVTEAKDRLSLDLLRVYEEDKLSIAFDAQGKPSLMKADPATGEKKPVNDHLGEAMMFLPMILGGRGPI